MTGNRPTRPGNAPQPLPRPPRPGDPSRQPPRENRPRGGNGGGNQPRGGGGGQGGNNSQPSLWLGHPLDPTPNPDPTAGFVEYLRWMRAPLDAFKDGTKAELAHQVETTINLGARLKVLNERTQRIASDTFQVTCPWRIRVGGAKGPESMLLPAFDPLGIPYIPSSTLRGVARSQAIRELMQKHNLSWEEADKAVAPWLGHLEAEDKDSAGKVIFLDAYPVPTRPQRQGDPDNSRSGGLAVDIANNVWRWNGNSLEYKANPNVFFSLKQATFLIGIRKGPGCTDEMLAQVKEWLIRGLEQGVGSQVNTGYGRLIQTGKTLSQYKGEFLRLPFELEGQLIHGRQVVNWKPDKNRYDNKSIAEVRPVAFKNMLRYWFRTFALGVLPVKQVQEWEGQLFGAITPQQKHGWIHVDLLNGKVSRLEPNQRGEAAGQQEGILVLSFSSECQNYASQAEQEAVKRLFTNLTWMMFHLGGVGQGARRPCYSRQNRERAPWWRGSTLIPRSEDAFWKLAESVAGFQKLFQKRLGNFFDALKTLTKQAINPDSPRSAGQVQRDKWPQAVDANCRIVVCSGEEDFNKPYALATLHRLGRQDEGRYDKFLCGGVQGGALPSPVWIADLGDYQVVTVFGATADPRKKYLEELKKDADDFQVIWPSK
ncbi:CRISPR-associated protein Cmr6 [Synechococcus sp. 60AY4M2]|uniref:RAMP superfamily CRISPR-associated protein n=1 Tax=unclassified Synechococcus TaxID=2626047 RepID=UPI000C19884C|nr:MULTISPECIES: RAMP superfamily CRISPR-associated protein [unclassified Synechococcus]PIK95584.1 CRISPR-associated protein Cmr6 [Synechococcus sp. 60AY4M2]PIK97828.1 CRISPR-associated protein Cmr6 [Synechococcus sp. 63AY4M1]